MNKANKQGKWALTPVTAKVPASAVVVAVLRVPLVVVAGPLGGRGVAGGRALPLLALPQHPGGLGLPVEALHHPPGLLLAQLREHHLVQPRALLRQAEVGYGWRTQWSAVGIAQVGSGLPEGRGSPRDSLM